jgi:hypothetical protein
MRRLVFTDAEITAAINAYLALEWSKLQVAMDQGRAMGKVEAVDGGGTVLALTMSQEDPLEFSAKVKSRRGEVGNRVFSAPEMMNLLIVYCRAQRIPLARAAKKTLRKAKVGYALDLTIRKWPKGPAVTVSAKTTLEREET